MTSLLFWLFIALDNQVILGNDWEINDRNKKGKKKVSVSTALVEMPPYNYIIIGGNAISCV